MRKNVYCIHTNIVTKNGDKKMHESICPETRILRAKNVGKKSSVKSTKNRLLYTHEYRDQKMGIKKCTKQFSQKHTNSATLKCWEKNRL